MYCIYRFPQTPVIPCGATIILCGLENNCSCQIDNHFLLLVTDMAPLYTTYMQRAGGPQMLIMTLLRRVYDFLEHIEIHIGPVSKWNGYIMLPVSVYKVLVGIRSPETSSAWRYCLQWSAFMAGMGRFKLTMIWWWNAAEIRKLKMMLITYANCIFSLLYKLVLKKRN